MIMASANERPIACVEPMKKPTVASYIALRFIACWKDEGCSTSYIESLFGEHYQHLEQANYRVPFHVVTEAFRHIAQTLDDPLIGVKCGFHHVHSTMGIMGNLATTAKDIRETFKSCIRFVDIVTQAYDFSYFEDANGATIRVSALEGVDASIYQFDTIFCICVRFIQVMHSESNHTIYLTHTPPPDVQAQYQSLLQSRVVFGHEFNAIYLDKSVLDARVSVLNQAHFEHQLKVVQDIYESIAGNSSVRDLVKRKIRQSDRFDCINLEQIADQLYLSPRTLQNKLKESHTSFRQLLDEAKMEKVETLVAQGEDVASIAKKVGFSDSGAFYRAFKRLNNTSFKDYISAQINT